MSVYIYVCAYFLIPGKLCGIFKRDEPADIFCAGEETETVSQTAGLSVWEEIAIILYQLWYLVCVFSGFFLLLPP